MSKTIKLDDETYHKLEAIRRKRETFSQAVARLLTIEKKTVELLQTLDEGNSEQEVPRA